MIAILALGVFALWFALDPFPEAVWKEFVLGENAGKFEARSSNYLLDLVRGGDSIWMLALTTLANAGLFTFVLISTLLQCWRERRFILIEEVLLLLLVLAFFIVFSLPSQRSGRYLLPVMPAFAALIAMHWDRLPLWGFRIALLLQFILFLHSLGLGATYSYPISWVSPTSGIIPLALGFMGLSITLVLLGLLNRERSKGKLL